MYSILSKARSKQGEECDPHTCSRAKLMASTASSLRFSHVEEYARICSYRDRAYCRKPR